MPSRHWSSDVPYTSRAREGFPGYARLRTDNPHAVTAPQVGLGNVDNTSDADKPIGDATQAALDLKAPLASPVFTGDPQAPTPAAADNDTSIATTAFVKAQGYVTAAHTHAQADVTNLVSDLALKAPLANPIFTGYVRLSTIITPAALGADVNNWAPDAGAAAAVWLISATTPVNITGVAPEGGNAGRILILHNTTSTAITLKHDSASSTGTNRFTFSGGVDVTLNGVETLQLMKMNNRWRALGAKF
jgi:hypothetical protein